MPFLFVVKSNMCNFADDNILKTSGENERAAVEKSSKFASEFFIGSK